MDKILTLDVKFNCSCAIGNGVYGFYPASKNTKMCGKLVATTSDKLVNQSPGVLCKNIVLPSGGNGLCTFVHSMPWENSSKKIKHEGKSVLTEKSITRCPTFQIPLKASKQSIQNKVKGE